MCPKEFDNRDVAPFVEQNGMEKTQRKTLVSKMEWKKGNQMDFLRNLDQVSTNRNGVKDSVVYLRNLTPSLVFRL